MKLISESFLRGIISENLGAYGPSDFGLGNVDVPIISNPNCDNSGTMVTIAPVNNPEIPHSVEEFDVAVRNITKNLPDEVIPTLYLQVKELISREADKSEDEDFERYEDMTKPHQTFENLRQQIRSLVLEALDDNKNEKDDEELLKSSDVDLSDPLDTSDVDAETSSEWDPDRDADEDEEEALKPAGDTSKDNTFKALAQELGISIAGAKRLEGEGLKKLAYMNSLGTDDVAEFVEDVADKYIEHLAKYGGLDADEVFTLQTNLDHIIELDGFRQFMHKEIRKSMQADDMWDSAPEDYEHDDPHSAKMARLARLGKVSRPADDDEDEDI